MKRKLSYRILSLILVLGIILSTVNMDAYAINYGGSHSAKLDGGGFILPIEDPDLGQPDDTNPDGNLPNGEQPDGTNPDGNLPNGEQPDGNQPDGNSPDGNQPDGTNPDGNQPDGNNPDGNDPEAYVGIDLTNQLENLGLSLSDWWYLKEDSKQSVDASAHKLAGDNLNLINYAEQEEKNNWSEPKQVGASVCFDAKNVKKDDYFTVVFPKGLEVSVDESFSSEDVLYTVKPIYEEDGVTVKGTELRVTFLRDAAEGETLIDKLPLRMNIQSDEMITLQLQNKKASGQEGVKEDLYRIVTPVSYKEGVPLYDAEAGDDISDELKNKRFSIHGRISYIDDADWKDLIRPKEFDQKIKLEATYIGNDGSIKKVSFYAQDDLPGGDNEISFEHDGKGAGTFDIGNVPKYIYTEEDGWKEVKQYEVSVDSNLPYYQSNSFTVTDMEEHAGQAVISLLEMSVVSAEVEVKPSVVGDDIITVFPMTLTVVNNTADANSAKTTETKKLEPTNKQSKTIDVPVGLQYTISQSVVEGYKFSEVYTITTTPVNEPVTEENTTVDSVSGTSAAFEAKKDTKILIETVNASNNISYPIQVNWIDNNSSKRPSLTQDNFKLYYKVANDPDAEWIEFPADYKEVFGLDDDIEFHVEDEKAGEYKFHRLPSMDPDGNILTFKVEETNIPSNYSCTSNEEKSEFTLREILDITATIDWLDNKNNSNTRPTVEEYAGSNLLTLYRHIGSGDYELIKTVEASEITDGDYSWNVLLKDYPRYTDNNEEYDYVLVQGSIGEDGTVSDTAISNYQTHYANGSGNNGNDTSKCHNGGEILQLAKADAEFYATKVWQDEGDEESVQKRPNVTVTLWRFSLDEGTNAQNVNIDDYYSKSSRAVYHKVINEKTGEYKDVLLSYNLGDRTTITFNRETVGEEIPEDFKLPKYDEQGKEYVYFVRETADSDDYEASYKGENGTKCLSGAESGGTVVNTRHEKVKLDIQKVWQNYSELDDINGTSVEMSLYAPLKGSTDGRLYELTVYSDTPDSYLVLTGEEKSDALTLTGFSSGVPKKTLSVYANLYNEEGHPYDLSQAVVREKSIYKTNGDEVTTIPVSYEDGKGTFTLDGNSYISEGKFDKEDAENGMKRFRYYETNTITGTTSFRGNKQWHKNLLGEYDDVKYIAVKLTRISYSPNAKTEVVASYGNYPEGTAPESWMIPANASSSHWSKTFNELPKYDKNGYLYSYNISEEGFVLTDGTYMTVKEARDNRQWGVDYTYYVDSTSISNYKVSPGGSWFTISKSWDDNGDAAHRKSTEFRLYRMKDLREALNAVYSQYEAADARISLDSISVPYVPYILTEENKWTQRASLTDVESKLTGQSLTYQDIEERGITTDQYIVLEYKFVEDDAKAAEYEYHSLRGATYSDTKENRDFIVMGYLYNSERQYQARVERDKVDTTIKTKNRRIGQVNIKIEKIWNDEEGTRPDELQFLLYQDDEVFQHTITYVGDEPIYVNGHINDDGNGVTFNKENGVLTIKNTDEKSTQNVWNVTLDNLPLFAGNGLQHIYNFEEVQIEKTDHSAAYLTKKYDTDVKKLEKPDSYEFTYHFKNTVSGEVEHNAYIYWHDEATGGEERPDVVMTLYRYLKSDYNANPDTPLESLLSYEECTDYKDPLWEVGGKDAQDGQESGYDWKITASNLPKYNEDGQEYVYVFKQALNNGGSNVFGEYEVDSSTINPGTESAYEKFTNTIHGNMKVSGDKTWRGMQKYDAAEDLPNPTIQIYRSLTVKNFAKNITDAELEAMIKEGTITLVNETVLLDKKDSFRFPDSKDPNFEKEVEYGYVVKDKVTGEWRLPKFDNNGRRYNYIVREKLTGIADLLFTKQSANGSLENQFVDNINRREIVVEKEWAGRNILNGTEKQYPSVTFYLYRYLKEEGIESAVQYATGVINSNEFTGANGKGKYTFKDLLIYSPSGRPYGYFITEKPIKGYTITYRDEPGLTDEALLQNEQCDIISIPDDWFKEEYDINGNRIWPSVTVGSLNSYDKPEYMNFSGSKYWNDYNNSELIYGERPDHIDITITRRTVNEDGQVNLVSGQKVDFKELSEPDPNEKGHYVVWGTSPTDPNYWIYTLYNMECYAGNGMPYIYSITETKVPGYKQSTGSVSFNAENLKGDGKIKNELVNSLGGTYYFRKNWADGYNKYGLRPDSITVVLQRSKDGVNFENIGWDEKCKALPSVMEGPVKHVKQEDGTYKDVDSMPIVSAQVDFHNEMDNTKHSSWEYTFTNLPEYYGTSESEKWIYRCVEAKIGAAPIEGYDTKKDKYEAGAYQCIYKEQSETQTVVQNKLSDTSLYIKKIWENDDELMKYTRPDKLLFKLQKREVERTANSTEDDGGILGDWVDVCLDGPDKPYTFYLYKDGDPDVPKGQRESWSAILKDLPVASVDEDGVTYYNLYFRAVEVYANGHDGNSGADKRPDGYLDYEETAASHSYVVNNSRNESYVTNSLIKDDVTSTITVTKQWNRQPGAEVEANFELLYKTGADDKWHCFADKDFVECSNGTETGCKKLHSEEAGCMVRTLTSVEEGSESFTWTGLPKYDKAGNEMLYKVVERPIPGYKTEIDTVTPEGAKYPTEYEFTNIELRSFSITKSWVNTDYSEKEEDAFTSTFVLQRKVSSGTEAQWENVTDEEGNNLEVTFSSKEVNSTHEHTWTGLPKYTVDGEEIIYRALETGINGTDNVSGNTNGAYVVTYTYGEDKHAESQFEDTVGTAENRFVYGFVNMSKAAAYLDPNVTDADKYLEGVTFDIYEGVYTGTEEKTPFISEIPTNADGQLVCNADGTYGNGEDAKYLVSGTYTIVEHAPQDKFSKWVSGISFNIGTNGGTTDTGEHGTAWIYTETLGRQMALRVSYVSAGEVHSVVEETPCRPWVGENKAFNLESRGVLQFTKTGEDEDGNVKALDAHSGAVGESKAYFGVFLDEDCTEQVAGLYATGTSENGLNMVLTTKGSDGTDQKAVFTAKKQDAAGKIPYLRVDQDGLITLLSGEYYIKEMIAPPGYILDEEVRKVKIPYIVSTALDSDLSLVYSSNYGLILEAGADDGSSDYQWKNKENVVEIYKRDQFGRRVRLKPAAGDTAGYLEFSIDTEGKTFLTGEKKIRLYQDADASAKKLDGTAFDAGMIPNIVYNESTGSWTLTGLLDIDTVYRISEPGTSVPDNNTKAEDFIFTVSTSGEVIPTADSKNAVKKSALDDILLADGLDYDNYYQFAEGENKVVLRDIARYLKPVSLKKENKVTNEGIQYISFELYKYSEKEDGTIDESSVVSVLEKDVYLTTDKDGLIDLSKVSDDVINQITECPLNTGLDIGKYYFREVERGASDQYRLAKDVFFEISPKGAVDEDGENCADIVYQTTDEVEFDEDTTIGIVKNTPVEKVKKELNLTKLDAETQAGLSGAKFVLKYTSVNDTQDGHFEMTEYPCVSGDDGILYVTDEDGNIVKDEGNPVKPDISKKGLYELREIQAPDYYMTLSSGKDPVQMLSFRVNSKNQIEVISKNDLVTKADIMKASEAENAEHTGLKVDVNNNKTVVTVEKLDDLSSLVKTADQKNVNGNLLNGATLAIYEGVYKGDGTDEAAKISWVTGETETPNPYTLPDGTLKELTVYTLHEEAAPTGYLAADDIYFMIFGTVEKDGKEVSEIYVWTAKGKTPAISEANWPNGTDWSNAVNRKNKNLVMVDEAIIAPVDMQKVVGDSTYEILPGAIFEVRSLDGNVLLGTAESAENGYLVWKTVTAEGYAKNCIYNEAGKRVAAADSTSVLKKTIILQENENGYSFKETYAPDHAFNKEETLTVKVNKDNYISYRTLTEKGVTYDKTAYVDIKAANAVSSKETALKSRNTVAEAADYVNPAFETTFEMFKYDPESSDITEVHDYSKIGINGATFTLSKKVNGTYTKVGDYKSDEGENGEKGLLSIPILEKGDYLLKETTPQTGYKLNDKEIFFTVVNDDYKKTITYDEAAASINHTKVIKDREGNAVLSGEKEEVRYELPNDRIHGTVTLTKIDDGTGEKLNGVQYRLIRTSPARNELVDAYFPSSEASSLVMETGKTYTVVATADSSDAISAVKVTGTDGVLRIEDLQWGTYSLQEVQEKDGYIISETIFTFEINAENAADDPSQTVVDAEKETVSNTKNSISFKKEDLEDHGLKGARFELHAVTVSEEQLYMVTNCADYYPTKETGASSKTNAAFEVDTTVYGLTKGKYVLREILAPEGYELAKDVYFEIDEKGVVSNVTTCTVDAGDENKITKDTDGSAVVESSTSGTGVNVKNTVTVKDRPIEVSLTKVLLNGSVGTAAQLTEDDVRGKAVYEITGIFANETKESTKTFTGNVITDDLKAVLVGGRTYKIEEVTAPAGYKVPTVLDGETATLSVGTDGTVTIVKGKDESERVFLTATNDDSGIAELTFSDEPIEITLNKVKAGGKTIDETDLGYAVFTLEGKLVNAEGNAIETSAKVDGLTSATFRDTLIRRLIAEEEYKITETHAPDGYKLTAPFYIKINKKGEVYTKKGSIGNWINLSAAEVSEVLKVLNDPIELSIRKVEDNDVPLKDAIIEITPVNADDRFVNMTVESKPANIVAGETDSGFEEKIIRFKSTESNISIAIVGHLVAGVQYRLHEVERVYYHEIMDDDIIFHMTEDGQAVIDTNSEIHNNPELDAAALDDGKTVMTVQNPIIKGTVILTKYWKESSKADNQFDTDHLLPNAVYTLTRTEYADGTAVSDADKVVKTNARVGTSGAEDSHYEYAADGTVDRFVTDAAGKIRITGLPEGRYYFSEVDAPKAYHINDEEAMRINFEIRNKDQAKYVVPNDDQVMDIRINASISLTKITGNTILPGAVFDVTYSETENGTYKSIGKMTTGDDGNAVFTKGTYSEEMGEEGLRRGFYKLVELNAKDQMLTKADGTRNTIFFEIGNKIDKEYKVDADLQQYLTDNNLKGVTINNKDYISLPKNDADEAVGVKDTPIPTKKITVEKKWAGDTGLIQTFRPDHVMVQLYRQYPGGTKETVGFPVRLDADHNWKAEWTGQDAYVNILTAGTDTYSTKLYTYTVVETEKPDWYSWLDKYSEISLTQVFEKDTKDQGTESTVTNTLVGGAEKQILKINKTLGGGSKEDTFYVRVFINSVVSDQGTSVDFNRYYKDTYTVKKLDGTVIEENITITDTENCWMEIHGGETVEINLPKGASYEIEEKLNDGKSFVTAAESGLDYTPRYVSGKSGTIGSSVAKAEIRNAVHKELDLRKLDESDYPLTNTSFKITYTPLAGGNAVGTPWGDDGTAGVGGTTERIITGNHIPVDLTLQGTYTIEEYEANDYYDKLTDNDGNPVVLARIKVDALDVMTIEKGDGFKDLVTVGLDNHDSVAKVTVKNEKSEVRIGKTIDYARGEALTGALLSVYEMGPVGDDYSAEYGTLVDTKWSTETTNYVLSGLLREGYVYRLHEVEDSAPVGYLEAEDIYFVIDGTYTAADGALYSRIVITDSRGAIPAATANKTLQNADGTLYGKAGVLSKASYANVTVEDDGALKLVDKRILVPVDLKKVLNEGDEDTALEKVQFSITDKDTDTLMGIAETNSEGFLVWKEINTLTGIYTIGSATKAGEEVTSITDSAKVINKTVVLMQNESGYEVKEIYAPDHAYNDSRTFTVTITDENFKEFLAANNLVLNIKNLIMQNRTDGFAANSGTVENEKYTSTVMLHKYDADEEAAKKAIPGTEFTLYLVSPSWGSRQKVAYAKYQGAAAANTSGVFVTDENGDLKIDIPKKGYYILEETKAAPGYKLDQSHPVSFKFRLVDDDELVDAAEKSKALTSGYEIFGYNESGSEINTLKVDEDGVPNTRLTATVSLTKKDSVTLEALDGVIYTLTRNFETVTKNDAYLLASPVQVVTGKTYTAVKNGDVWSLKEEDGTPGTITITGLNWDSYTLKELTELSGYVKKDTEYTFTFGPDAADKLAKRIAELPAENPTFVGNDKNEVVLRKTDILDSDAKNTEIKGLAGAVFELHKGEAGDCTQCEKASFYIWEEDTTGEKTLKTVTSVTAGEDGSVTIYGLPTDRNNTGTNVETKYHLVETKAPDGYKIASPVAFTIDRYGKLQSITKNDGEEDAKADIESVVMEDAPIKIFIDKIGMSEADKLSEAEFVLTDVCEDGCDNKLVNGELKETVTTDETGSVMISIERVKAGHTYKLEETKAPDGYECTAIVTFTVDQDGRAALVNDKTTGGYIGADIKDSTKNIATARLKEDNTKIEISNEKISLSICKEDYDDADVKLGGVEFTMKPATEQDAFTEAFVTEHAADFIDGAYRLVTSSETGTKGWINIPLDFVKHDNSYIITETGLGDNTSYKLPDEEAARQITVKVEKDGTLTFVGENGMYSLDDTDKTKLIVRNEQIKLDVTKLDLASGTFVEGVTFKLSRMEGESYVPVVLSGITDSDGQWTTTAAEDGKKSLFGSALVPGSYKLEETAWPENYNRVENALLFTIEQSGRVTKIHEEGKTEEAVSDSWVDADSINYSLANPDNALVGSVELTVTNAKNTDLKVLKVGNENQDPLSVKLTLEYLDGTEWKYAELDADKNAVVEGHKIKTGDKDSASLVTDETTGTAVFGNLPDGVYRLHETETAEGYNLLSDTIIVEINRNKREFASYAGENVSDSAEKTTLALETGADGKETDVLLITVINKKGQKLPATGSTTPKLPLSVLPIAVILEGLILYIYQSDDKRKKKRLKKSGSKEVM